MSKKINIIVANSISDVVFRPCDWSVIPLPDKKTKDLAQNLYNMPSTRHIALVVNRNKKNKKIQALKGLYDFKDFSFYEEVSMIYDKPSTSSSGGLLPLSETGYIFYKGNPPDASKTAWYSEEYKNATSCWHLAPQDEELKMFINNTYCYKFSWEIHLLMYSLCSIREYSRFLYGLPLTDYEAKSLAAFCDKYNFGCDLIVESEEKKDKLEKIFGG